MERINLNIAKYEAIWQESGWAIMCNELSHDLKVAAEKIGYQIDFITQHYKQTGTAQNAQYAQTKLQEYVTQYEKERQIVEALDDIFCNDKVPDYREISITENTPNGDVFGLDYENFKVKKSWGRSKHDSPIDALVFKGFPTFGAKWFFQIDNATENINPGRIYLAGNDFEDYDGYSIYNIMLISRNPVNLLKMMRHFKLSYSEVYIYGKNEKGQFDYVSTKQIDAIELDYYFDQTYPWVEKELQLLHADKEGRKIAAFEIPGQPISMTLEEAIEKRLRDAESNKKFKDSENRKKGAAKERAAIRVVSYQNLEEIESDAVVAERLVTKDAVWPEYDIEGEKIKGTEPGAAYWKTEIRAACGSKPFDSVDSRQVYVKGIEKLKTLISACDTLAQLGKVYEQWTNLEEVKGWVGDLENLGGKEKATWYRNEWYNIRKKIEAVFGVRLLNTLTLSSESAKEKHLNARLYNPFTKQQQDEVVEQAVDGVKYTLERIYNGIFTYPNEQGKIDSIKYYEQRLEMFQQRKGLTATQQVREANWSWATSSKNKTGGGAGSRTAIAVNTKEPLSHIIRKGGMEVPYISSTNINNEFADQAGFYSVEYGNSLPDREREQHANRFYQAMVDWEELTGLSVKKLNQFGNLGIAFGSRGKSGHAATYFGGYRVINLSRKHGDGSLAHEYWHYLDDVLARASGPKSEVNGQSAWFASESGAANPFIADKVRKIMHFIKSGTSKAKFIFKADDNRYRLERYKGETIEDTIKNIQRANPIYANYREKKGNKNQREVYGKLAAMHGLEFIEVTLTVDGSQQYSNSKAMGSEYWIRNVELFARAGESYIWNKMERTGVFNNYLQSLKLERFREAGYEPPYPEGKEADTIYMLFEDLVQEIAKQLEAKSTVDYSKGLRVNSIEQEDEEGRTTDMETDVTEPNPAAASGELAKGTKIRIKSGAPLNTEHEGFGYAEIVKLDWVSDKNGKDYVIVFPDNLIETLNEDYFEVVVDSEEKSPKNKPDTSYQKSITDWTDATPSEAAEVEKLMWQELAKQQGAGMSNLSKTEFTKLAMQMLGLHRFMQTPEGKEMSDRIDREVLGEPDPTADILAAIVGLELLLDDNDDNDMVADVKAAIAGLQLLIEE